jgi:hypothetical protein
VVLFFVKEKQNDTGKTKRYRCSRSRILLVSILFMVERQSFLCLAVQTVGDVLQSIEQRLRVYDATAPNIPPGATDFMYPMGYAGLTQPVGAYLASRVGVHTSNPGLIIRNIASDYMGQHPEITGQWWFHLDPLGKYTGQSIFKGVLPNEQFIIGQGDRVIRFFNFGEPLSEARQADCRRFVDLFSQWAGERAYDFITDVVIGDFAPDEHDGQEKGGYAHTGYGLVLMNTAMLRDDTPTYPGVAEGNAFL